MGLEEKSKKTVFAQSLLLFFIISAGFSCASIPLGVSPKTILIAEAGSVVITKACKQTKLKSCDDMGESFKQFEYNDKTTSSKHAAAAIEANTFQDSKLIIMMLDKAASLAGEHGNEVKRYTQFLMKGFSQLETAGKGIVGSENDLDKSSKSGVIELTDPMGQGWVCLSSALSKPDGSKTMEIAGEKYWCITTERKASKKIPALEPKTPEKIAEIKYGTLFVSAKPKDAVIFVGIDKIGVGQAEAKLSPGYYTVKIFKDGYNTSKHTVEIKEGWQTNYSANLFLQKGIWIDTQTGYWWQSTPPFIKMTWEKAQEYCGGLSFARHSDWYLPDINKLKTLLTEEISQECYWQQGLYGKCGTYWSSSSFSQHTDAAWNVSFNDGHENDSDKIETNYVRCYRAGVNVPSMGSNPSPSDETLSF